VTIHRSSCWLGLYPECDPTNDDQVEDPIIMRALEPEAFDVVWTSTEPLIPPAPKTDPLGCHRLRVSDRLCVWGILIRLVTGCSWVSVEAILGYQVSDTTLRARRDEWVAAGFFGKLREHNMHAIDRIIGVDLSEVAIDGSLHKAPCGVDCRRRLTSCRQTGWRGKA
jgi:transposase